MKFLSVLLITCILFLSSFSGIQKPVEITLKTACCKQMKSKMACHHSKKDTSDDDRDNPCCTMLLTCSMCGFLIVEPVIIKPGFATPIPKPTALYKIGDLAAYHSSNWKPPKMFNSLQTA